LVYITIYRQPDRMGLEKHCSDYRA
jgi:hypothetical protein